MRSSRWLSAHGFTLIELLVVVLIIGVLIAVSAPAFLAQTQKAQDSAAKQYLTYAWKSAKADAVDNPAGQGLYRAPQALASAIQASEPELSVAVGTTSCPNAADTNPKDVFIDPASTSTNLILCNDPNHTVWTLTASNIGAPTFSSQVVSTTTTLTTTVVGQGTVTSSPAGISCGSSCQATFNTGTQVTLTAAPSSGYSFSGWSGGGCTGTGACTVSLSSATSVTATFVLAGSAYYQAVTGTTGLVGYWRLDDASGATTVADASGGGHPGTPSGVTFQATSLLSHDTDAAAIFAKGSPGSNVDMGDNFGFTGTQPFSVEAWVSVSSATACSANNCRIVSKWNGSTAGWLLWVDQSASPQLHWGRMNGPNTGCTLGTGAHYIVGTYDGSTNRLYVDGVNCSSTPDSYTNLSTTNHFYIGGQSGGDRSFSGTIDEVAVYNVALSAATISNHYAAR